MTRQDKKKKMMMMLLPFELAPGIPRLFSHAIVHLPILHLDLCPF